jgi:hypothetical protein
MADAILEMEVTSEKKKQFLFRNQKRCYITISKLHKKQIFILNAHKIQRYHDLCSVLVVYIAIYLQLI